MKYIWVNPVAAGMYEPKILEEFLAKHGYKRFEVSTDWIDIVRKKYDEIAKKSEKHVIDMRCPKAVELVKTLDISGEYIFPDIFPILIHCGQEAEGAAELLNENKVITTPCKALADMGNALKLSNTKFIPWNEFVNELGDAPKSKELKKSPIPPGFFEVLDLRCKSLTGEEEIRDYFTNHQPDEVQLVEILYCKEGCHNGDGVCFS